MKLFGTVVIFLLVLVSCESASPVIMDHFWQLNLVKDQQTKEIHEELALHILGTDADGNSDLEYLYIINDEQEIFWVFTNETWDIQKSQDGNEWITLNNIQMADLSPIPRGRYRLVLIDLAGERDELEIVLSIDKMDLQRIKWPEIQLNKESWILKSPYALNVFWVYGINGTFLKYHEVLQEVTPVTRVLNKSSLKNSASRLNLYSYNETLGFGLILENISIP